VTNPVLSGLIERRTEILTEIRRLEVRFQALLLDLEHLDATILQFDPPHRLMHPVVRNIDIRDVTSKKSKYALQLRGFPDAQMNNIHFERCTFDNVANPDVVENVKGLTETEVKVNGKQVG